MKKILLFVCAMALFSCAEKKPEKVMLDLYESNALGFEECDSVKSFYMNISEVQYTLLFGYNQMLDNYLNGEGEFDLDMRDVCDLVVSRARKHTLSTTPKIDDHAYVKRIFKDGNEYNLIEQIEGKGLCYNVEALEKKGSEAVDKWLLEHK